MDINMAVISGTVYGSPKINGTTATFTVETITRNASRGPIREIVMIRATMGDKDVADIDALVEGDRVWVAATIGTVWSTGENYIRAYAVTRRPQDDEEAE